jgi:hypothetical protein
MKIVTGLLAATMLMGVATAASAQTYANARGTDIATFGNNSTITYGQTFTAPGGTLSSWTFYNTTNSNAGEQFAIGAWDGTTVTSNLFTAGSNAVSADAAGYFAHTVSGINLALTAGVTYYAYYTTYNVSNPVSGVTFQGSASSPLGGQFLYGAGNINTSPVGAAYTGYSVADMRYSATFAATPGGVPEPATWAMLMLGFGGIGFGLRRAHRRSEAKFNAKIERISRGLPA